MLFILFPCPHRNWFPCGNAGPDREIGGLGAGAFGFSSAALISVSAVSVSGMSSSLLSDGVIGVVVND